MIQVLAVSQLYRETNHHDTETFTDQLAHIKSQAWCFGGWQLLVTSIPSITAGLLGSLSWRQF